MKVVVSEMLFPEGHVELNKKYISILSNICELTVVDDGKYFSSMNLSNCNIITFSRIVPNFHKLEKIKKIIPFLKLDIIDFIAHYINLIRISIKIRKINYDRIIFFSARNDTLGFALPLFKRKSVYVFHHVDLDLMSLKAHYLWAFKRNMSGYYHITLADFIKTGMIETFGINPDLVKVVYQPIVNNINFCSGIRKRIIIGLGKGIDPEQLDFMIQYDKSHKERLNYQIILRDNNIEYVGRNLVVTKEYFSRDKYERYLNEASLCVILYPFSFNLRYSGVADDALSHGLPVIGNDIKVINYFSDKYPGYCHVINDLTLLFKLPDSYFYAPVEMIERFRNNHSDKNVSEMIKSALDF